MCFLEAGDAKSFGLQSLYDDLFQSVLCETTETAIPVTIPVKLRRRHSIADVQAVAEAITREVGSVRTDRENARKNSNALGVSLDVVKELHSSIKKDKEKDAKHPWLAAYKKLSLKAGVLRSRAVLSGNDKEIAECNTARKAMEKVVEPLKKLDVLGGNKGLVETAKKSVPQAKKPFGN